MSDHGQRPSQAVGKVGPGEKAGPTGDANLPDHDTEGHRMSDYARAVEVGPGEKLIRGDGTPADFLDDRDTEGHIQFRRLPSDSGE